MSFKASVRKSALVESVTPIPPSIPETIAMTFLIDPHTSTPIKSAVSLNLVISLTSNFLTNSLVLEFNVARVSPIGTSLTISTANVGPLITAILLVFKFFSTTSFKNKQVSFSIPLVAIKICISFVK